MTNEGRAISGALTHISRRPRARYRSSALARDRPPVASRVPPGNKPRRWQTREDPPIGAHAGRSTTRRPLILGASPNLSLGLCRAILKVGDLLTGK